MNRVSILDCTLRDGGYVVNFNFGQKCIVDTIKVLSHSGINIVECGFLRDGSYNNNKTLFPSVEAIEKVTPHCDKTLFVAMIQIGKFDVKKLPEKASCNLGGIRLTFHKNEIKEAIEAGKIIKNKGYLLFFQPVGTTSYQKNELTALVNEVNDLQPFAFYLVDTLGVLNSGSLVEMYRLVDSELNKNIKIGFHSHNNLQLSFANSQTLIGENNKTSRELIIDSSIYGMGRGAGNLNTELICSYLNSSFGYHYLLNDFIKLIDEYYREFKKQFSWGYSIEYFLSSINGCHPNYSSFLLSKNTLSIDDIGKILESIPPLEKEIYNESLIEKQYYSFMKKDTNLSNQHDISSMFKSKNIILIAPGKTSKKALGIITSVPHDIIVSINGTALDVKPDYFFFSNKKKFEQFCQENTITKSRFILTSNIENMSDSIEIDYFKFLDSNNVIKDNAGLMALKFISGLKPSKIYLIGFDGFDDEQIHYRHGKYDDYGFSAADINKAMSEALSKFDNIVFLTKSKYEKI